MAGKGVQEWWRAPRPVPRRRRARARTRKWERKGRCLGGLVEQCEFDSMLRFPFIGQSGLARRWPKCELAWVQRVSTQRCDFRRLQGWVAMLCGDARRALAHRLKQWLDRGWQWAGLPVPCDLVIFPTSPAWVLPGRRSGWQVRVVDHGDGAEGLATSHSPVKLHDLQKLHNRCSTKWSQEFKFQIFGIFEFDWSL
jgi:hypothetical protein